MNRIALQISFGSVLCLVLAAAPAGAAGEAAPEKLIKARQSAYFLMGQQMARINATVKGDLPFDKPALGLSAEALEVMSRIVADQFPAGTDQGNTRAKPEVWKDQAKFKQLMAASQTEASKLKAAVHGGDMAAIKAAYGSTSRACKACHDSFKDN